MRNLIIVLTTGGAILGGLAILAAALLGRIKSVVQLLLSERLDSLHRGQERIERSLRDEIAKDRDERATSGRQLRDELRGSTKDSTDATVRILDVFGERLDAL